MPVGWASPGNGVGRGAKLSTVPTATPDALTLALALITDQDNGQLTISGPTSVPAYTSFDLDLLWDMPPFTPGDLYYGVVELGTDGGNPGNIGHLPVRLERFADDVSIEGSATTATISDTLTYTLTIQPNVMAQDVTYALTNTIPFGLRYVDGSVTGGATVQVGDVISWVWWSGVLPVWQSEPVTITYQVMVEPLLCLGTATTIPLTNTLAHSTDNPGSVTLSETANLLVDGLGQACAAAIQLDFTLGLDGSCDPCCWQPHRTCRDACHLLLHGEQHGSCHRDQPYAGGQRSGNPAEQLELCVSAGGQYPVHDHPTGPAKWLS